MLDRLSVPRRPLDFEDYIDILRRNISWIIGPVFAGLVVSTMVAYFTADRYVSWGTIRIVPQQVSEKFVPAVSTQDIADVINAQGQNIFSRNTLTSLINNYGLYKKELKREPMDDVLEKMKKDIWIGPTQALAVSGRPAPAIVVTYGNTDRFIAQKVCADLISRFMNAAQENSSEGPLSVDVFFSDELKEAKRQLDEAEKKLADFRAKNAGHLPDEVQMNLTQMSALESRLDGLNGNMMRNNEQRMTLETQMAVAKEHYEAIKDPQSTAQNLKVMNLDRAIAEQEDTIANMKERYKEGYPDLEAAQDRLAFLKRQKDQASKEKPVYVETPGEAANVGRGRMDAQDLIKSLQVQMKINDQERRAIEKDIQNTNAGLREFQNRLNGTPAGEKEFSDLLRDRDIAKQHYLELEGKRSMSAVSVEVQRRKQGESLELIDNASLPMEPAAPQRQKIVPIGAVVGLFLGLALVGVREMKDTSLKNLKDARLYTQLSILGSIPLLENDLVVQRRKQFLWVGWATATIVGLAIIAGSVAHYYLNKA